jgi:hypothetical protein
MMDLRRHDGFTVRLVRFEALEEVFGLEKIMRRLLEASGDQIGRQIVADGDQGPIALPLHV